MGDWEIGGGDEMKSEESYRKRNFMSGACDRPAIMLKWRPVAINDLKLS